MENYLGLLSDNKFVSRKTGGRSPLRRHSNLPSIIDEPGVPQLLACGANFESRKPGSGGRHQIGTPAGFKSESVAGLNWNSHSSRTPTSSSVRSVSGNWAAQFVILRRRRRGRDLGHSFLAVRSRRSRGSDQDIAFSYVDEVLAQPIGRKGFAYDARAAGIHQDLSFARAASG